MSFEVGDIVVYPHHGTAEVVEKSVRTAFGESKEYLELRIAYAESFEVRGDLRLSVPVEKIDDVGLRPPIDEDEVEDVLDVLAQRDVRLPSNWSRRFKNHVEKLKSGEIWDVAEVVRNMALREQSNGLSAGEKSLYNRARRILVSELAAVWSVDVDVATKRIDEILYEPQVPAKATKKK